MLLLGETKSRQDVLLTGAPRATANNARRIADFIVTDLSTTRKRGIVDFLVSTGASSKRRSKLDFIHKVFVSMYANMIVQPRLLGPAVSRIPVPTLILPSPSSQLKANSRHCYRVPIFDMSRHSVPTLRIPGSVSLRKELRTGGS